MTAASRPRDGWLERLVPEEHARLVRLCAYLTGDACVAEDLAQETLVEAWRHRDDVYDAEGARSWLFAIARNVCRRWMRSTAPHAGHTVGVEPEAVEIADTFDLEVELERDELAHLLDRALALLPPSTREALIERYVNGASYAEVAERLGISEGAATMRLQRGKLTLQHVLLTRFPEHAAAYGLQAGTDCAQETRIWCPFCGADRLRGVYIPRGPQARLQLRCPSCCSRHPTGFNVACADARCCDPLLLDRVFGGVKGYKPALHRLMAWVSEEYRQHLPGGMLPCYRCGAANPIRVYPEEQRNPALGNAPGIHADCARCGALPNESAFHMAVARPEGRGFWREHRRIRALPIREIEVAGVPAYAVTLKSVTGTSSFTVILRQETFETISVR